MGEATLEDGQASLPSPHSTKSYWHKEPSEVLLGYRTTPSLPQAADIIIIGSGITGAITARCLKEDHAKDASVLMLEAREACWGATGRNGGHCQPIVYASTPSIASFELQCFHFLRDLVVKNGIPCDWVDTTGVHGFFNSELFELAEEHLEKVQKEAPSLAKAATSVGKASASPSLTDLGVSRADGAMWQANAASLWPYKLIAWVLEDLISRYGINPKEGGEEVGFNLQTNTPVTHLQRLHSSTAASPSWIVHTPRGQVSTSCIVLAANAYTSHLLPSFTDLLVPVRGQVAALVPNDGQSPLAHTYVFLGEPSPGDDYLIQRPGPRGELIFGGGRMFGSTPTVGISNDDEIDTAISSHLRSVLPQVLDLKASGDNVAQRERDEMDPDFEWTGIMGFSRDGHPWVGAVPESLGGGAGLWICGGYTGHGMPQAALCAKAVAEMISGQAVEDVNLPREFHLTEQRVSRARTFADVAMQTGLIGLFWAH